MTVWGVESTWNMEMGSRATCHLVEKTGVTVLMLQHFEFLRRQQKRCNLVIFKKDLKRMKVLNIHIYVSKNDDVFFIF